MPQGMYHHLGRETFLAPVEWNEEGWPVVNGNGTVDLIMDSNNLNVKQSLADTFEGNFDNSILDYQWNFVGNPYEDMYSLTERNGYLRIYGSEITLNDVGSPSFIGKRQQHFNCKVETLLDFKPENTNEEAGFTVIMDEKHHYEIAVVGNIKNRKIIVRRTIGKLSSIVAEEVIADGAIKLEISADMGEYHFKYAVDENPFKEIADGEIKYLSSEVAGGFIGVYFGLYATGNGFKNSSPADFEYFKYKVIG
jgi:alpha-N-arabinofuranosidase